MEGKKDRTEANRPPDIPTDCLECRITGFLTLSGVSAYALYLKAQTPLTNPRHRLFYSAFSVTFAGLAIARVTL